MKPILITLLFILYSTVAAEEMAGIYASSFGKVRVIEEDKDHCIAYTDGSSYTLTREQDGTWSVKYRLFGLMPIGVTKLSRVRLRQEGRVIKTTLEGKVTPIALKVTPRHIPASWKARQGTYVRVSGTHKSDVKKVIAKITDGFYVLKAHLKSGDTATVILEIQNNTEAIILAPRKQDQKKVHVRNSNMIEIDSSLYKKI